MKDLAHIAMQVKTLQTKLERFDRQLPRTQDIGQFIKDINALSNKASLKQVDRFEPGVPTRNGYYIELPIKMNFEGDFMSIFTFLKQSEQMQRLTRIKSVSISCKDSKQGSVNVKLTMNIYCAAE